MYIQKKKPELYNLLVEEGELEEYLTGYQLAYSNCAEKIAEKLAAERGEKKFMTHWKRKFSSNKKFGHSQKEEDQFFYVKELELSNGLLYDKILKKKESEP